MNGYLLYVIILFSYTMFLEHTCNASLNNRVSQRPPLPPQTRSRHLSSTSISYPNQEWIYTDPIRAIAQIPSASLAAVNAATMQPRTLNQPGPSTESSPGDSTQAELLTDLSPPHNESSHSLSTNYQEPLSPKTPNNLIPPIRSVSFSPDNFPRSIESEHLNRPQRTASMLQRFGCIGIIVSIGVSMTNLILLSLLLHR